MCDARQQKGLIIAPLPSQKRLWEASDVSGWMAEREKGSPETESAAFALAVDGELVRLDPAETSPGVPDAGRLPLPQNVHTRTWRAASWEEWCIGMDEFGGLIMLAASLTE